MLSGQSLWFWSTDFLRHLSWSTDFLRHVSLSTDLLSHVSLSGLPTAAQSSVQSHLRQLSDSLFFFNF